MIATILTYFVEPALRRPAPMLESSSMLVRLVPALLLLGLAVPAEVPPRPAARIAVHTDHEFDAGSRIETVRLSVRQVENLVLLGKVWGFLKYHHPLATTGKVHWDYEVFRVLPSILRARDRTSATSALAGWIDRLGAPRRCEPCAGPPDSAQMLPRIGWIHDRGALGGELVSRLERAHRDRPADGRQYYVSFEGGIIPGFQAEQAYSQFTTPDAGYRLLALFRLWNIIEYWSPYRDLIRVNWDGVLAEFIPRVMAAKDRDSYSLAMIALVARVEDGHAGLWANQDLLPPRGPCQVPVRTRQVEGRVVVTGYAHPDSGPATRLRIGDVILEIDGEPVDSLFAARGPHYPGSNEAARIRFMHETLTRGECRPCRIRGEGPDGPFERDVARIRRDQIDGRAGRARDLAGEAFQLLDKDVAYLKLSSVEAAKASDYVKRAAGTRCLVIDIRNYPSDNVVHALGGHLARARVEFVRFTGADPSNPGAFVWTPAFAIEPREPRHEGAVVVLVDESSVSNAEFTAMAFRAAGARIVGSPTAGADGNLVSFALPGGLRGAMSGIGVFYPDRRPTQQIGILPDLEVRPTIRGIRAGRDEVLEAAIRSVLGRDIPIPTR